MLSAPDVAGLLWVIKEGKEMKYYGLIDKEHNAYGFTDVEPESLVGFVTLTDEEWQTLLDEQSNGKEIVFYKNKVFTAERNRYYVDESGEWQKRSNDEFKKVKAQAEYEEIQRLTLTQRQLRLYLLKIWGLKASDIEAHLDEEGLIEWQYASVFVRNNALFDKIAELLGKTSEDIDTMFKEASSL